MSDAAVARTDRELHMLETLVDGAYALGVAFCEAANAEHDHDATLVLFDAFQRASLAVRMGIRLSLALRTARRSAGTPTIAHERAEAAERAEREPLETERPESEPLESERERERDYEPVSLPRFLATLGVVAQEADRLPTEVTAGALPTLRELLAHARPDTPPRPVQSAAAVAVLTRPPPTAHRSALLSSAAPPRPAALSPRPRPPPRSW
jgi:hypothetical protein